MRVGVFDSGLGGLTVLKALIGAFPQNSFVYLGDTARTPYGSKSPEVVARYSVECARFLLTKGIDFLVVACNTASSLAMAQIQAEVPCPVVGTIEPSIDEWVRMGSPEPLLILGTRATVQSQAYQRGIISRSPESRQLAVACPLFVPLVEEGILEGPIVDHAMALYLDAYRREHPTAVMLGCTHYPLLRTPIARFFGPQTRIIDSPGAICDRLKQESGFHCPPVITPCTREYYVTDDPTRFQTLAERFLGEPNVVVSRAELASLPSASESINQFKSNAT
jgi:glutamate racemase